MAIQGSIWPYLAAGSEVLALGDDALVVVNVVLPAVLGLVHVREAGIGACHGGINCVRLGARSFNRLLDASGGSIEAMTGRRGEELRGSIVPAVKKVEKLASDDQTISPEREKGSS